MAETQRKMNSKLESLQYVGADAALIASGSPEDESRRARCMALIGHELKHSWQLADALRRYLSLAARYHRKSLHGGLTDKQWEKLNKIALALDDALDHVEDALGMDILIGDVDGTRNRPALRGASRAEPNKQGEVAMYVADFERILRGELPKHTCPHCGGAL